MIFIVTGQTATGKTKLAVELAAKYNGELVNCDSRQVYKYLDVITGKDIGNSKFELINKIGEFNIGFYKMSLGTSIWLLDIVKPSQYFSSYDYNHCALWVINDILKRGKTPIIVGGTYFYLKHLLYGVETESIPPNQQLRKELEDKTIVQLQKIIKSLSLQSFNQMNHSDKNNPRRLIRKIEIENYFNKHTGRPVNPPKSTILNKISKIEMIGLRFKDKHELSEAVKKRVEERLKNGAIEEVKQMLKTDYSENDPGLKTIGYQQISQYLKGRLTKKQAVAQWIVKELQYAKRQSTFMKKDKNIKWRELPIK